MATKKRTITPTKLKPLALLPESPEQASPNRGLCRDCGRFDACRDPFVREDLEGWNGKLLVLFGQRVSNEAVDYLVTLLSGAGYQRSDYCFLDAVRCFTGRKPSAYEIRACRPFFVHIIKQHKPEHVLAIGDVALRLATDDSALKTITPIRGISYMIPGCEEERSKVYGTYDVEDLLSGSFHYRERISEDILRTQPKGLDKLLCPKSSLPEGPTISVDTEFMPDGRVVTISAASRVSSSCGDVTERDRVTSILGTVGKAQTFVGHSAAVDLDSVLRLSKQLQAPIKPLEGWLQGKNLLDTLALARMVDENRGKGGYKLETLLRSSYHAPEWKSDDRVTDESNPESWPTEYRVERCRLDSWASAVLADNLAPLAKGPLELTHSIIQTLRRIYHAGAYVDKKYFEGIVASYYKDASKAKQSLQQQAAQLGMVEFIPTNDGHIRDALFDRLKLGGAEKTKTGKASVNKTFLKQHANHPFVKQLLEFNTHDKRHSTYGSGLATKLKDVGDGKALLRFRINPLGARTGRRASEQPNAQNWPKDVRLIVVSRFKDGAVADNDYSKLEVILFAWTAKEWKLLEFFLEGNGYIAVGKELFGKEVKDGTDDYRVVKSIVLGIQYGMGAYKLAYQLWNNVGVKFSSDWESHVEHAAQLRQRYLSKFPGISRYMYQQRQALIKNQQVVSLTGRVRHLPCPYGEDTPGFGHLLNQAINFPIQSLASDVTGSAMVDIERELLKEFKLTYEEYHYRLMIGKPPEMPLLINEVHDDLVYDLPKKDREDALAFISHYMSEVPTLRTLCPEFDVPLNTGQKVGSRWGLDDMKGE